MAKQMSRTAHRVYIGTFIVLGLFTLAVLITSGANYYGTPREERFFHPDHDTLKPSGAVGHGLGIVGTLFILIGVSSYMIRKRKRSLRNIGVLKHWLEFHIFLCAVGPLMVLFHTAFKFGGIVSVSFWSMVGVVISGIIGRFIYIQIPRTIEGRELSLNEVREMRVNVGNILKERYNLSEQGYQAIMDSARVKSDQQKVSGIGQWIRKAFENHRTLRRIRSAIRQQGLTRVQTKQMVGFFKDEMALNARIERLQTMQRLFRYWHVAHLPFAIIMLVIMVIHVAVTLTFGYRWIF